MNIYDSEEKPAAGNVIPDEVKGAADPAKTRRQQP